MPLRPHRLVHSCWLLALTVSWPGVARAQEAADDPFVPGLVATLRDGKGATATRVDHQLAFHWGTVAPDPRLADGEFQAVWQGQLLVEGRGDHRFYLYGAGEVELKVGGKVILARQILKNQWCDSPPVTLAAEHLPFELTFRRTQGDARLAVFWSGPQFGLEPIPSRLLFHPRERSVGQDFTRGQLLARTLRCAHCHEGEAQPPPAPALDHLAGNISREWLTRWLAAGEHPAPRPGGEKKQGEPVSPRRMPAFGLSAEQAGVIADWLLAPRAAPVRPQPAPPQEKKPVKGDKKVKPDARAGEQLFLSLGCLACHTWRDQGASGWLGGGDLTHVADKRPADFFALWLVEPAKLNRDHRMPVFTLSNDERTALALFLGEQKSAAPKPVPAARDSAERRAQGKKLSAEFGCAACHRLPEDAGGKPGRTTPRLGDSSDWQNSCLHTPSAAKHRPGYQLGEEYARVLRLYYSSRRATPEGKSIQPDGRLLLAENNCLACHAREGTREAVPLLPPLLADKLMDLAKRYPDLAPQIPALTPPALNSIGDKLTDQALADAVTRRGEPHRPYLHVRMPRFPLRDEEVQTLVQHLAAVDRVPPRGDGPVRPVEGPLQDRYVLAGGRLVSSDGFGCTSCHQVGSVLPSQAQLNARGPILSQLDRRVRREWFDRFVRNPARIVPRMEMPSVQFPVAGTLDDKIDEQLAAVWHVLNVPGFEPPPPNPIRTLRHSGNNPNAEPVLLTDILKHSKVSIKPFLTGLANRHNVLLDLETAALSLWTVGDSARQGTKGKSWFWELAGTPLLDTGLTQPDLALVVAERELPAELQGQFLTEADTWQTEGPAVTVRYRLSYAASSGSGQEEKVTTLRVARRFAPLPAEKGSPASGFVQALSVGPLPAGARLRLRLLSPKAAAGATLSDDGRTLRLGDRFASRIVLQAPANMKLTGGGRELLLNPDEKGTIRVELHYLSEVPIDRFPELPVFPAVARKGDPVEVAPGFIGERLPLLNDIMPTALAWRPDGRLVFASLKGQVFEALDTDRDGSEDRLVLLADGLPSPYGIHGDAEYVDVCAKYALLRVWEGSGRRVQTIASGWGYTDDYHDWNVGLPRNDRGEYFLGIPCQQDKRPPAAARFHGNVLKLVPRKPTEDDPRLFALKPVSFGHRFPMGLALDRRGELFVTDNQGNYNPFNELNHVRPGAHFGFINALDRGKLAPPPMPPAIDIPHPWTRSVNGICFLDTPKDLRARLGRDHFGPLEGHLVGCEYDTRRLVRMTLQQVGDTFQGAAYPLSLPPTNAARGLQGPVACAMSPRGELYVGSIRDSGWGAGNNVGEIVRIRIEPDKLPSGIAEVRATPDGFVLDFFRPVDRALAGRAESYTIQSYRRVSTPAYGGPDLDRRTDKVSAVSVAEDARRVTLKLAELRPGFVYEFRLKSLAPNDAEFHPAEAHYTLRVIPK